MGRFVSIDLTYNATPRDTAMPLSLEWPAFMDSLARYTRAADELYEALEVMVQQDYLTDEFKTSLRETMDNFDKARFGGPKPE